MKTFAHLLPLLSSVSVLALACGCASSDEPLTTVAEQPAVSPLPAAQLVIDEKGDPTGLQHFKRWSPRLAQGAQPEGEQAFANLAALGFKVVVSVDGAPPDLELAGKHGLRYVHVPIGYDGIPDDAALKLATVAKEADGPIYIHCHHGLHRGPAAASIARLTLGDVANERALEDLATSGCSPSYKGLYRDVGRFQKPGDALLSSLRFQDLPSVVRPVGEVAAMVAVDEHASNLKESKAAAWAVPPQSPDVRPSHEAGMLENLFRGMISEEEQGKARPDFLGELRKAQQASSDLEQALLKGGDAEEPWKRLQATCTACHNVYRN